MKKSLRPVTDTAAVRSGGSTAKGLRRHRKGQRSEHLKATISHFDELSTQYDHYALKRQDYLGTMDHIILEQIGRCNPCSYLDVGCGTGRMLAKIKDAFPASRGFGIDISPQMVETCRAKGLHVAQADFFSFQPATTFDVVFLEFNVFGYLIVQNGLADSISHLRRLVGDRGTIVFDILNPFCLTYARLRRTLPTAIGRCCSLLAKGGECQFTYSVGGTPIAMGLAWSGRIESGFRAAGYKVERHAIKYADHRWLKPLPRLLTSQFLFVATR
ncbi:MAG: class I SAM-dependent methyltransferase [Desulfobulbaceae bacterium]